MICKLCKKSPKQTKIFLKNGVCIIPCVKAKTITNPRLNRGNHKDKTNSSYNYAYNKLVLDKS